MVRASRPTRRGRAAHIAAVLAVLALFVVGLRNGTAAVGLTLTVDAGKATFAAGEPVTLTVRLINRSSKPVRLEFRTAQRFDVLLKDASGREVWRWSADRMFSQALAAETLPPGGGRAWTVTVEEKLRPGDYRAVAVLMAENARIEASVGVAVR